MILKSKQIYIIVTLHILIINSKICENTNQWQRNPRLYLSTTEIVTPTIYDFSMIIDSSDQVVSKMILQRGTWQPNFVTAIAEFLRPGQIILNLGSQTGMEAIIMAKFIGPSGFLYIFEPYSKSYRIVMKNVYLNNVENWTKIYRYGAADIDSKEILNIDQQNTGHSNIILGAHSNEAIKKQQIFVKRVDDVLNSSAITLDLALIDVEGLQVEALMGMVKIIDRSPNLVIIVEWKYPKNENRNQTKALDLIHFLINKEYRLYIYKSGSNICQFGRFEQLNYDYLLRIEMDIFFIPKTIEVPQKQKIQQQNP